MTSIDETSQGSGTKPGRPGLNDMAEDIFGLSLRGLATIRDSCLRPAIVFTAARTPDWQDRYTPSVRMVTSLIALMLLLRIFWAGENSSMYQMVVVQMEALVEQMPDLGNVNDLAEQYFNTWALIFPVVYLAVQFLVSLTVRIWGKNTSTVSRIRLYFVTLIPGLVLAVLNMLIMPFVPVSGMTGMALIGVLLSALVYGATAYRGLAPMFESGQSKLWRAMLLGFVITLADLVTSITGNFAAGIWIGMQGAAAGG